jgi:choline dehydrogenase-like flavoprotein
MPAPELPVRFNHRKPVDFVIIGSGAAGGVLARELSTAGFDVVVLEQGPYRTASDFSHDEFKHFMDNELTGHPSWRDKQSFRATENERAELASGLPPALYARTVGGSSVHMSANYWRMRPVDFKERSLLGAISGTGFADWPISYEELEPYYTRAEWELGVSGAPGPFDPPRSRPYPLPPMPIKSSGALLEQGAKKMGLHPQPAPVAILSRPYKGRPACSHCGFCMGFGCEMNAKSSSLAAMLPEAEATGHCEIRPLATVFKIETGSDGRVNEVAYLDASGQQHGQKAKAVILAANGAETPRLLLMSESSRHPNGLGNSSGLVGKYLMGNAHGVIHADMEHPLNDWKSIQVTRIVMDFYNSDPKRGFYGGGGIDARPLMHASPLMYASNIAAETNPPRWGRQFKQDLNRGFAHHLGILTNCTSLPLQSNNISLDPNYKDDKGRPTLRITYRDHDDDLATTNFLLDRAGEIMDAVGAQRIRRPPVVPAKFLAHLLGTCRMGNDPATSVVDKYHRSHDVPNLFMCDGSSLVSSGRGQPTLTIQALAFRAAEHIAEYARKGEI